MERGTVSKQLGSLVALYARERRARQEISAETATSIRYVLLTLVDVAGWDTDPAMLTKRHIQRWLTRDVSIGTLRAQFSVVRGFCRWLVDEGYARRDVTRGVRSPREPERLPRGLNLDQCQAILAACPDARHELMVLLMLQLGLRVGEVSRLEVGDIDFRNKEVLVRGKGGKQRVVSLTQEAEDVVRQYLRQRPARVGPLVRHEQAEQGIGSAHVSQLVSRVMHAAGVDESAHALRHTFVGDMLRAKAHIRDVQQAAGHASIDTTQRYMPWLVGDLHQAMGGRRYRPDRSPKLRAIGAGGDGGDSTDDYTGDDAA